MYNVLFLIIPFEISFENDNSLKKVFFNVL